MYKLTTDLQSFFEDRVLNVFEDCHRKNTPPAYRTRHAISKLAAFSPSKGSTDGSRINSTSSSSDLNTLPEEPYGRRFGSLLGRDGDECAEEMEYSDAEDVLSNQSTSISSNSGAAPVSRRQTRSMRKVQLSSVSSFEKLSEEEEEEKEEEEEEEGFSMTLRKRLGGARKRKVAKLEDSDEEEEVDVMSDDKDDDDDDDEGVEGEGEEEESVGDTSEYNYAGGRSLRMRKRKRYQSSAKGQGEMVVKHLRKRCKVLSYAEEEEEEEEDYNLLTHRTVVSRSGRVVKPTLKFS